MLSLFFILSKIESKVEGDKNGYKVRLHFTEDKENYCMIEELQKLLVETYINNLLRKGER